MIVEEKDLRDRYASMSDEELAEIARFADLTDIAKKCLKYEIGERGLDIESHISDLDKTDRQQEKRRQNKIHEGRQSIKKFSKPFYISGAVFFIIGLAFYLFSEPKVSLMGGGRVGSSKEEQLGLGAMGLGCLLIIFAFAKALTKLAALKLILRK